MAVIEEEIPEPQSKPTAEPSGYNSDGYETASETELISEPENNVSETHEKALEKANDAKIEGNSFFKDGLFQEALEKYAFAIQVAPDGTETSEIRSICYANRAACFSKLGKHEETIKECTKALELNPTYMKALIRRAEAREKLEHFDEAITDFTKILELDPSNSQARRSIVRIKPLADEKREKMKEEMIGKLKEMGNSVLGRFGMSVDNFKAVQDPNTGKLKEMGNSVLGRFGMSVDNFKAVQDPNTGKLKEMGNSVLGRFGMSVDNFKAVQDPNTGSYSISFQR